MRKKTTSTLFTFALLFVAACGEGDGLDEGIEQSQSALVADEETQKAVFADTAFALAPAAIEAAIAYGEAQVDGSLYTGCSAGSYRMGGHRPKRCSSTAEAAARAISTSCAPAGRDTTAPA